MQLVSVPIENEPDPPDWDETIHEAFAVMRSGIDGNICAFDCFALRLPRCLELAFQAEDPVLNSRLNADRLFPAYIERLYERIAYLTDDLRKVALVQEFNRRSRLRRLAVWHRDRNAIQVVRRALWLTAALTESDRPTALKLLDEELAYNLRNLKTNRAPGRHV